MGMEFDAYGVIPFDGKKYKAMKAVYDNCERLGIEAPEEVQEFFESDEYGDIDTDERAGKMVGLDGDAVTEWGPKDGDCGYVDVDIRKVDPAIKIIRFRISGT